MKRRLSPSHFQAAPHGDNRRGTHGWQQTSSAGIRRVIGSGILLLLLAAHLTAQAQTQFEWRDASGNVRSLADLEEILREHRQWIESIESDKKAGTHANLSGAILTEAKLDHADLSGAILTVANLSGAILLVANLTDAYLGNANLSGAFLAEARVGGTVFEPKSLPELTLSGISQAQNLELLTYYGNPAALVQLRKQFQDGGLREQERKIAYALKRREAELSWARGTSRRLPGDKGPRAILWSSDSVLANFASFTLNKVFFDWTCQYGMSPGRPLILGVVLWFLCSFLYFACIHTHGEAGLYRVYGQSIGDDPSAQRRVERISPLSTKYSPGPRLLFQFFRRECLLLRTSMFFSLMSAFNIGFRDINFGRWLRLLTRQEFDIKAVGWARVIAGWQSLISVYLIALWVMTYFGRPFD